MDENVNESAALRARFGDRVRIMLARAGMSDADLSAQSNLPLRRTEKILRGKYGRLTINEMELIARIVGAPLHLLLAPAEMGINAAKTEDDQLLE